MKIWERSPQASGTAVTREPEEAGDPHNSEETSGPQRSEESRIPEGSETRAQGETEETRGPEDREGREDPKEAELRDPEGSEENPRGPEENAETRDPGKNERIRGPEENEGVGGPKETEIRDPEGSEENPRGPEESEGIRGPEESEGIEGPKETELRDPEGSEENPRGPEENAETRDPGKNERISSPEENEGIEGPKETEIRDPEGSEENPRGLEESEGIEGPKETELRDPQGSEENPRGPVENAETRDPGKNERIRGPDETEVIEGLKETEIRDSEGYETTSDLEKTEKIRGPEKTDGIRGLGDTEETRGPGETKIPKETEKRGPEESEGIREPGDIEDNREPEHTETKSIRETEGIRGPGHTEETRGPGVTWIPEKADNRGPEESEKTRVPEENRTPKETEVRGPEEPEGIRDPEESKEARTPNETEDRGPEGYKETRTPDKPKDIRTSRQKKLRGSVRFEIRELEEPDSSQERREPKETGDPELPNEPRDLEEVKAMAQKGCLSLTKYFLFVFNIFFFVLGSLVFCFGLWILIDKNSFASYLGLSFVPLKVWSYALAISGVLTGFLSLLGCLGALKEIRCLLGLYFSFLLLLFTIQITIGVLIYTQHGLLERKVKDIVLDVIRNYHKYPDAYSTAENWDFVQFQLRCCGWTSPQDWLLASSLRPNGSVPSGHGRTSTASPTPRSDFVASSQTSEPVLRVPCSCQNTSAIKSTPQSSVDDPRASQPAAGPGTRATVVSAPGIPVVLPGPGSPGTPARLRSGELCSMPADGGIYQEGCSRSIVTWLHNNLISIVGVSLGLGLLEVAAVGLTLVLLPHTRAWGSRYQGLEGESSAARGGGNCGSGTSWSSWGMACRCTSWGSQAPSRLPAVVERWLPRQRQASRPSTIWSTCRLEPQSCE